VPQASSQATETGRDKTCHLRRLVDFAEPRRDDTCLDVGTGSELTAVIRPLVRDVTGAAPESLPSGPFTLVVAWLALSRSQDPAGLLRGMLAVCKGRVVVADLIRTRAGDGERIERLRDPARTAMRSMPELLDLVRRAGGWTRRLDGFTIERPIEPWLAQAKDSARIREELAAELDGGPVTGARPRMVGRELWFAQSWAFLAIEPAKSPESEEDTEIDEVTRPDRAPARR
jgi:hypothetical protein